MTAAKRRDLVSVSDYLAGEMASPTKHEYVAGVVYAMAGARNAHNLIATNAVVALGARLRGKPCRMYNSDTKVRIRSLLGTRFYYPDASVVCHPNPPADPFQDQPALLVEVLSPDTRRTDEGEKREAYLAIPSLSAYLLVEQDLPMVVAYHRAEDGFTRAVYETLGTEIPLRELDVRLPLAELYDGVEFVVEEAPS
jgi:Uma2 family endonuclease